MTLLFFAILDQMFLLAFVAALIISSLAKWLRPDFFRQPKGCLGTFTICYLGASAGMLTGNALAWNDIEVVDWKGLGLAFAGAALLLLLVNVFLKSKKE